MLRSHGNLKQIARGALMRGRRELVPAILVRRFSSHDALPVLAGPFQDLRHAAVGSYS